MKIFTLGTAVIFISMSLPAASQQMYFYPTKGQTPQQQQADHGQCHVWATQQSGFDPARAPIPSSGPQPQGGVVRGAAGGAMLGVVGGAIGGNVGKGAAIGAGVGALFGGMRQRRRRNRQQAREQQQQAAYAQQQGNYKRALGACMSGRGYSVS